MNYSVIEWAKERYVEHDRDYQKLVKEINLQLFSLARTNFNEGKKNEIWRELINRAANISSKAEEELNKLENIRFSEGDFVLQEEKNSLVEQYRCLLNLLREEKSTLLRQIKKEMTPIVPLQQKLLKIGYCYFCDISISGGFPYKLEKEEKNVLNIEVVEGAEFCSQECLLDYCKEYKNREKLRQEKEKESKDKIESDKKLVTEIQEKIGNLVRRINELERKGRELELSVEITHEEENKNVGFFRRLGQRMRLVKKNTPRLVLEETKKKKASLERELEKENEELQKALIIMSIHEQVEKERQKLEKRLAHNNGKIMAKEEEEDGNK